jgi:hypothetical protein
LFGSSKVWCFNAVEKVPHCLGIKDRLVKSGQFQIAFHVLFRKLFKGKPLPFTFIRKVLKHGVSFLHIPVAEAVTLKMSS